MTTDLAALMAWIITAGFGASLFITWLARGGVTQHSHRRLLTFSLPPPYFPAPLVFSHFLLAATGLIVWIAFLLTDSRMLAWVALVTLLPVALAGFSMFSRWLGSRRLRLGALPRRWSLAEAALPRRRSLPESRLPTIVVICHGLFGATTIVLVLFSAIGPRT